MSKIAWTFLLSSLTVAGAALYPTIGFANQVSTSASDLLATQSVQKRRTSEVTSTVAVAQAPKISLESEKLSSLSSTDSQHGQIQQESSVESLSQRPATPFSQQFPQPIASSEPTQPCTEVPNREETRQIQDQLREVVKEAEDASVPGGAPAFTLFVPNGYGIDKNTIFATAALVANERIDDEVDGAVQLGVGLLDSTKSVGLELSYSLLSFGTVEGGRDFGEGAFNIKVHRQFPQQRLAVAAGYIGFASIGDATDIEDSPYGVVTKFFVLRPDLDKPLSRLAVTAGIGAGSFQLEDDFFGRDTVGPFGSVAVRLARPVSAIVEWSGEDLGFGVSYALRLSRGVNFVVTPSVRDLAGAGDGPRFILGTGISYRF